ncbi:origin recognition complex subunit 4 C-terminus-domain-containing protein [Powellomyces hirtus]|nr:origin recognition complex subunit 4 C-terminus-domain-containing protein [Powellomyces hirtus]
MKETSITVERNVKITEISSASSAKASAETKAVPIPIPTSISEAQVLAARKAIARRLNERSFSKELIGIKEQYDKIYDLLDRTVRRGESNSILLVGNRATGKTTLVRKALQNLVGTFPKQANGQQPFLQINLSGLLQTDDRLALKEIVRQLHLQQSVDMANVTSGSFADCLHYVLETLRAGSVQSTPVVFVLEDIDLFAQHPKQALLYNLFDVCQSSQNPLAVVGLTTRIDFVDLLEKRVKSRFSHRQVCLYPPESFTDFTDIVKQAVHLIEDDGIEAEYMWAFNATVDTSLSGTPLVEVMKDIFEEDKDVRRVFRVLLPVVIRLSTSNPYVDAGILSQRKRLYSRTDPTVTTISSLSVLELILLVAMLQHERRQVDKYNFEMVYDEYREFIKRVGALGRGSGSLLYVKGVALKAFERLMALELCRGTEGVGVRCPKEYRMVKLVVGQADIVEGVRAFEGCPDAVTRWALR